MHQKIRPKPPSYPPKPWDSSGKRRPPLKPLPMPSYGGGRPPNMENRERVHRAIIDYAKEHGGHTPTRRELCVLCEISSTSVVSYHIAALIRDELLIVKDNKLCVVDGVWIPPEGTVKK